MSTPLRTTLLTCSLLLSATAGAETLVPLNGQSQQQIQSDIASCQSQSSGASSSSSSSGGGRLRGAAVGAAAGAAAAEDADVSTTRHTTASTMM